jgi:ABC-type antimicrobial peptide transport system permease subunit
MPGASFVGTRSLESLVEPGMRPWKLGATMFSLFGGLALVVAAVGLYSVITYGVARRMHEIGVRVALGAQTPDVLRLVVGEGVRIIAIGTVIGVGVALLATRFLTPLLYEVSARDPLTFGFVTLVLVIVAAGASLIPALRASRVDPNIALRAE